MTDAMSGGSIMCDTDNMFIKRHTIAIDDIRYIKDAKGKIHTEIYTSCINCTYVKKESYD